MMDVAVAVKVCPEPGGASAAECSRISIAEADSALLSAAAAELHAPQEWIFGAGISAVLHSARPERRAVRGEAEHIELLDEACRERSPYRDEKPSSAGYSAST